MKSKYLRNMLEAELKWIRSVMADMRSGELTWTREWAYPPGPPETEERTGNEE